VSGAGFGWRRTIAFASGDFAFNLYWQSISLYLLFYYTEAVGLSAAAAGLIYMVASIWDGLVDPLIGLASDRTRTRWGRYRPYLLFGPVPLALGFGLLYFRPPLQGGALVAVVMAAHLAFRSLYAVVNVPYAALTARVTRSAADRANIAGARMVFGTLAYVVVALTTQPIALWVTGSRDGAFGFFVAACLFAAVATPILLLVFVNTAEEASPAAHVAVPARQEWLAIWTNRAFWTLVMSGTVFVACYTVFAKSMLYYFKYVLHNEAGAPVALALAGASGLVLVPGWMLAARRFSKRSIWLASCAIFAIGLIAFALFRFEAAWQMQLFLIYMQAGFLGIVFSYWGMLPDTVEYGEWRSGRRAEGLLFGLGLLFQKVAIGLGAGAFGLALDRIGFIANRAQTPATLAGITVVMVALPLAGTVAAALIMFFNPLKRGAHEALVAAIAARTPAEGEA
jgi:GPH family glycoside/pentoside/hexuronide:cation symporter